MPTDSDHQTAEHVLVTVACAACDEIQTITRIEHAPESVQARHVSGAIKQLATEHQEATGHDIEVAQYTGPPGRVSARAERLVDELEDLA